jgi:hypothetical protein
MALGAFNRLTSGNDTTNAATYTTASVTMTAGRATFVAVIHADAAPETDPTSVASSSVSFTKFGSVGWATSASPTKVISFWYAVPGSTVTEAITITLPDAGTGCVWMVGDKTGAAATPCVGTPVSATDTDADITATHGALQSASNHQIGIVGVNLNSSSDVPSGTDWTAMAFAAVSNTSPDFTMELAENTAGVATALTYSGAGALERGLLIVEIAAAGGGSVTMGDLPVITVGLAVGDAIEVVTEFAAPDTPTCTVAGNTHDTVDLTGSAFADDDGDLHAASQWQVDINAGDFSTPVRDSGTDTVNKTSIQLNALTPETAYKARVRYKDDSGDSGTEWSAWSAADTFTTGAAPAADASTPGAGYHMNRRLRRWKAYKPRGGGRA